MPISLAPIVRTFVEWLNRGSNIVTPNSVDSSGIESTVRTAPSTSPAIRVQQSRNDCKSHGHRVSPTTSDSNSGDLGETQRTRVTTFPNLALDMTPGHKHHKGRQTLLSR